MGIALRESLFVLAVLALGHATVLLAHLGAAVPFIDPVYTRAALHSMSDMDIGGVTAVGVDDLGMFRVNLSEGSALLGRLMASAIADSGVLAIAILVLRKGIHHRRRLVVCASMAAQLQIALGLVSRPPSMLDLETVGLSFAVNAILPSLAGRRLVISDLMDGVPAALIVAVLVGLALSSTYLAAACLAGLVIRIRPFTGVGRVWHRRSPRSRRLSALRVSALTTAALIALSALLAACESTLLPGGSTVVSPPDSLTEGSIARESRVRAGTEVPFASTPEPGAQVNFTVGDRWYVTPSPSKVEIASNSSRFSYLVNGTRQVIHGMGLNTWYHLTLSPAERRDRLDADMRAMRAMGVNTLVGWDPAEFDEQLLDSAQEYGIGVVAPFELNPQLDYTDPALRAKLREQVLAWVARYRGYPALRMWGLGNEVLHKIVHPSWVGPQDPHQSAEARAFSDWLVETADAIHAADPNHPVTYRDAEDAFVGWLFRALERHPSEPRTWLVYGANCYQNYLEKIADNWPDQRTGLALWVSEFAPGGVPIPDRPAGLREMWGYVRKHNEWVLGGAVYAWTRNGPEEIDRNLGLTDDGEPVDGRSLETIASLFQGDDH